MFKSIALVFLVAAIAVNAVAIDHFSNENNVVAVLAASAPPPFRLQAWLVTDLGLVLISPSSSAAALFANRTALWPAAFEAISSRHSVILENGALPAFDDNGDLYFVRAMSADGFNDDYAEEWVLSFRHRTPKPVAVGDEGVPKIVLERRATPVVIQDDVAPLALAKITVDPGHGGSDAGAVAQGYQEKFFNLDVSLRFRDLMLADAGRWTVQMTRTTDVDVSLTARCNMANAWPANRFISIHTNSFSSSTATGTECYSYAEGGTAAAMRNLIQSEMIAAWGLTNRGNKVGNFQVLRDTTMPATLSEMGFITSPVDIKKLSDATARQSMANAHLKAIRRHYGV